MTKPAFLVSAALLAAMPIAAAQGDEPGSVAAPAPAAAGGADPAAATVSFWEIIERGGVMMYPLAGLSFIAISLILLYFLTIRQGAVVSRRFMTQADSLIRKQDYAGLLNVCKRNGECVARVTQQALEFATKNPTASFDEVREVTVAEGTRQASILTQRITYLADVGAIAPMVGLLGTVIGMIKSFNEIAQDTFIGAGQIQLAGGVSEALITTAAGLVIGIPALIFYSVFRGRVQRLVAELEAACTHLMALLAAQYKRATARSGNRAAAASQALRAREAQFALGQEKLDPHGI